MLVAIGKAAGDASEIGARTQRLGRRRQSAGWSAGLQRYKARNDEFMLSARRRRHEWTVSRLLLRRTSRLLRLKRRQRFAGVSAGCQADIGGSASLDAVAKTTVIRIGKSGRRPHGRKRNRQNGAAREPASVTGHCRRSPINSAHSPRSVPRRSRASLAAAGRPRHRCRSAIAASPCGPAPHRCDCDAARRS
jgi:hypothetical protein